MNLPPYPDYKNSGIPWIGRIPNHWNMAALRRVADIRLSNVDKHTIEGEQPVRLCNYTDVYYHRYITPEMDFMKATALSREIKKFELQRGDVLITKDSEDWKDIAVPAIITADMPRVLCGYHLAHIRPDQTTLHGDYLMWACRSESVALQFRIAANGVTRYALSASHIKGSILPLPPIDEQKVIGRFLYDLERKVNRFIRNRQRLIEVLNEQKQAIINRAVTRGLDPDVRLKPSGIDWLGDVPDHWGICRLRNVVSYITSGSRGWSSYAADEGPLFIRITNLQRTSLDLRFNNVVRLKLPATSEVKRTRVEPGDLLVSITAYIGSIAVVPQNFEEAYVSQHVARCSLRDGQHNPKWMGYVLLSDIGQTHGRLSLYGGTKDGLSLDDVKNYPMLLPLREEQDSLVTYLERSLAATENAIRRTQREINLIQEYRTRLIADVVTGKVDVRHLASESGTQDAEEMAEALESLDKQPGAWYEDTGDSDDGEDSV